MAEHPTTIYLNDECHRLLRREVELFGVQKKIINAAVWMFATADAASKEKAIRHVLKAGGFADAAVDTSDLQADQQEPKATRRKKAGA